MTISSLFSLTRWIIAASVILQGLAAVFYPGGTVRDPSTTRYSVSANFISDLGMTVSHSGKANAVGSRLFAVGFVMFAVAVLCCVACFLRLHSLSARGRQMALTGAVGAGLAGLCLLAAGLSPANVAAPLHMWFARIASAIAPPSLVLLALAAKRHGAFPSGVAIGWLLLALAVGGWFAMRWGPAVTSQVGLMVQASVQKIVAAMVVGVITYQTYGGSEVAETVARTADHATVLERPAADKS